MVRLIVILAILFCFRSSALAQTLVQKAKADELKFMDDDAPAMRKAFARAQATLDDFLKKAKAPAAKTSAYAIKVKIRDGQMSEYCWVSDFKQDEKSFSGVLGNEPRIVKNIRLGQTYRFNRDQIVDWVYLDEKGHMLGNFTMCALLTTERPEQALAARKHFGLRCD
jgi:uncharacterized protein YegJ (DUF2314 family)